MDQFVLMFLCEKHSRGYFCPFIVFNGANKNRLKGHIGLWRNRLQNSELVHEFVEDE